MESTFKEPEVISWRSFKGGHVHGTLFLDSHFYNGPRAQYWTRAFNGGIPGPTFRVKRGTTLTIEVHNLLGPNGHHPNVHNELRTPNSTNIHLHGMHISPNMPGDDVLFTKIHPGRAVKYTYHIPKDHHGGTFWYHPHLHGSVALQTGGGAAGAIIVEDELEDGLPRWLTDVEEQLLFLTVMPQRLDNLTWLEKKSFGNMHRKLADGEFMLINGVYQPTITITKGHWYRWRIVGASVNFFMVLKLSGCDIRLLATDGVYLPKLPRRISHMQLGSGNRLDVAVRCENTGFFNLEAVDNEPFTSSYGSDGMSAAWSFLLDVFFHPIFLVVFIFLCFCIAWFSQKLNDHERKIPDCGVIQLPDLPELPEQKSLLKTRKAAYS